MCPMRRNALRPTHYYTSERTICANRTYHTYRIYHTREARIVRLRYANRTYHTYLPIHCLAIALLTDLNCDIN